MDVLDGSLRLFIFSTDGLEMQIPSHLGGGRAACSLFEEGGRGINSFEESLKTNERREVAEECVIIRG